MIVDASNDSDDRGLAGAVEGSIKAGEVEGDAAGSEYETGNMAGSSR